MTLRSITKPLAFVAVAAVVTVAGLYALVKGTDARSDHDFRVAVADPIAGQSVVTTESTREPEGVRQVDDCHGPAASRRLVALQMETAVNDYLESLIESGHSGLEVALVRDLTTTAGVRGPPAGTDVLATVPPPSLPRTSEPPSRWSTPRERDAFLRALDEGGVRALLEVARADASALGARWGNTTLLAHLIRREPARFQRLSDAELAELSVGMHELGAVIEAGFPVPDFEAYLEATSIPETQFPDVARVAALQGRPAIFRRMIDLGADVARLGPLLDDLAARFQSASPDRTANYAEIVDTLVAAGSRPYFPSSLAVIQVQVPDASALTLHGSTLALSQDPAIRQAASGFATLLLDWSAKVDAAGATERRCSERSQLASLPGSQSSSLGIAQKLNHQTALSRSLQESLGFEEATSFFADLETKLQAAIASGDVERWRLDAADRMSDLAYAGRWHEAISIAEELQDAHGRLLDIALSRGAPVDVIGELVERSGGELPEDAILTLVSGSLVLKSWSGADQIVTALAENRGLNLHYVGPEGHNAVTQAAEHFYDLSDLAAVNDDAFHLVQYLVGQSVTMKPTPLGPDALDLVLLRVLETPQTLPPGIGLLRYLVDHGGSFERSHRQIAGLISRRDPAAYERLIAALPELRSAT